MGFSPHSKWLNRTYSEGLASRILSLPMFPELTDSQIQYTAGIIRQFFERHPKQEVRIEDQQTRSRSSGHFTSAASVERQR